MKLRNVPFLLCVPIVGSVAAAPQLFAQTAAPSAGGPAFEVASVRQNMAPIPHWTMLLTQDGFHAEDGTLLALIHMAYGIADSDRVSGGPSWIGERRFDIEAKFDVSQYPNITLEQRRQMLEHLLADRFKVAVRHQSKEFPIYALVVAKGGPKFHQTEPDKLQKSTVYGVRCTYKSARVRAVDMSGCTLSQLAGDLAGMAWIDLHRQVVDRTGLTGYYDFAVQWAPTSATAPDAEAGPSIFTALKEQLGLELRPLNAPLDTIAIENAEMPTEN